MSARAPFLFLILVLVVVGITSIYYRHVEDNVPLTTGERISIWQVEAEISFSANDEAVNAELTLPQDSSFELIEEFTASPAYGVHVQRDEATPKVMWSKRNAQGRQTLYYQGSFKAASQVQVDAPPTEEPSVNWWPEPYRSSAQTVLDSALERSGDNELLLLQIEKTLQSDDQNMALLKSEYSRSAIFTQLLSMARISSKIVGGLILEDGRRNQSLVTFVKVYVDEKWRLFNLERPDIDPESPLLIWRQDAPFLLDVVGGSNSKISFSISRTTRAHL